jgi:DNA-binding response OmpR family regulator
VILVVEDDAEVRHLLVRALGDKYTVFAAADGLEALDLLAKIPSLDAVVLDVMLPQVDGLTVGRSMKADPRLERVPILYLSAKDRPLEIVAGINAGARHYMTKPFKMPDLLRRIGAMVVSHS